MDKRERTFTIVSLTPSVQDAAASLDPLVQSLTDQDGEPVYIRRTSSIFFIPASTIHEHDEQNTNEKQANIITKCLIYIERFSGILYALVASFLFTCSNFVLKQLNIIIFDVLIIRFSVLALISFGFIMYKGYHLFPNCNRFLILIRSIFAAGGSISYYLALTLLPLADLTTIRYTQVVWTALIALIIFRERITIPTILASILTLIGVFCVAQPTSIFSQSKMLNETLQKSFETNTNKHIFGMVVAVSCALSFSISIVLNKKLRQKQVRQSVIMFYFLFITFLILCIIQINHWIFSKKSNEQKFHLKKFFFTKDYLIASIICLLQLFPMILTEKAIKREHPSIVTVVQASDILFAIGLENIFSSIKTNLLALMGSILVLTSIFIVGGYKLWLDRQNRTCIPPLIQENVLKIETKN